MGVFYRKQDAKKGWLLFLEHTDSAWKKRWVVVKRPYMFVYDSDRDPVLEQQINFVNLVYMVSSRRLRELLSIWEKRKYNIVKTNSG